MEPEHDFKSRARQAALEWKRTTACLPDEARHGGYYNLRGHQIGPLDICLPEHVAAYNLLDDIRDEALELFSRQRIVWHDGVQDGPSNHLLDSQVQCVNALGPGMRDPDYLRAALSHVLPIRELLPVEDDLYVTFEYIGAQNHLSERPGHQRQRGKLTTSTDAAIRYRNNDGDIEVALIEWKFTEDYRATELDPSISGTRQERYRPLWEADDCPVARDVIPYDDLFVEPFYQLLRQQLLARRMEAAGELGAERVRVVHFCPADNFGVRHAFNRDSHTTTGTDVLAVWTRMVRSGHRFMSVDSTRFVGLRGGEYAARYHIAKIEATK